MSDPNDAVFNAVEDIRRRLNDAGVGPVFLRLQKKDFESFLATAHKFRSYLAKPLEAGTVMSVSEPPPTRFHMPGLTVGVLE